MSVYVCIMGLNPSPLRRNLYVNLLGRDKKHLLRETNQDVRKVENYRKSAHCTYDIKYHIVWITKYRKPAITGKIAERTRELIRGICQQNEVEILAGYVSRIISTYWYQYRRIYQQASWCNI